MKKIVLVVLAGLLCIPYGALSSEKIPSERRPRIGLVLGGGGARGAAHVGVLNVLEELHIPIDCIAGTSMGAIVGGLYASGMSPEQMEAWFSQANWYDLLSDDSSRKEKSVRDKIEDFNYINAFEFGFNDGKMTFPDAFRNGRKLIFELRKLTLPVVGITDFDELPIPFRAVASDIVSGDMVVLKQGHLAEAIRASMAIPGVFAPFEIDGRLLVDGFVTRNLPISVAKQMDADIIIAVDVGTPLKPREELDSMLDMTGQMFSILAEKDTKEQVKTLTESDVYIRLLLPGVSGGDFLQCPDICETGYSNALDYVSVLQSLSVDEAEYDTFLARQRRSAVPPLPVSEVTLAYTGTVSRKTLADNIQSKPSTNLNVEVLKQDMGRLYRIGGFEQVDFNLLSDSNAWKLQLSAEDKSWGPNYLTVGLNMENNLKDGNDLLLRGRYKMTELNELGAEFWLEGVIGDQQAAGMEFYQPLDFRRQWFAAGALGYSRMTYNGAFENGYQNVRRTMKGADLGLGRNIQNWGLLRASCQFNEAQLEYDATLTNSWPSDIRAIFLEGALNIDTLDSLFFPRRGVVSAMWYRHALPEDSDQPDFDQFYAEGGIPLNWGPWTCTPYLELGGRIGENEIPMQYQFPLGGFLNMSGYTQGELSGQYVGFGALYFYRKIGNIAPGIGRTFNAGCSIESGNTWQDSSDIAADDLKLAGSIFIGADTFLGPCFLSFGMSENNHRAVYIYLGKAMF